MSSQTQFSAHVPVSWIQSVFRNIFKKAAYVVKSNSCTQTTLLGDTSVQKLRAFRSETGHDPESFPDRITFAIMFSEITN